MGGDAVWMGQLQRLDRCSDLVFSALRGEQKERVYAQSLCVKPVVNFLF